MAHTLYVGTERPTKNDRIFVDTSALFFLAYPPLSLGTAYLEERARLYSDFVSRCRRIDAKLFWCGLSLSEVGHRLEQILFAPYRDEFGDDIKRFRVSKTHRAKYLRDLETVWDQVGQIGESLDGQIDAASTTRALTIINSTSVDGYDAFYLDFMRAIGIDKVLCDDVDFSSVPNIIVFSANRRLCG